jgi:hypothetical protein
MNAVTSANTLDWRASASFNPALAMPDADPTRIYRFSGQCVLDRAFRRRVARNPQAVFQEHGFGEVSHAANVRNLDRRLQLGRGERNLLRTLASRTCMGTEYRKSADRPVSNTIIQVTIGIIVVTFLFVLGPPNHDE